MPKIKLKLKEALKVSYLLDAKISAKESEFTNTSNQKFISNNRKEEVLKLIRSNIDELKLIKEKIDAETFGKNG